MRKFEIKDAHAEYDTMAHRVESFKAADDGTFEGYASVFNVVDLGRDVVVPGAFAKTLGTRNVKMLWQHDTHEPIGVWDEVKEDEHGLFVRGRLLKDTVKGQEAHARMKAGAIDSMSIGFRTMEAESAVIDEIGVRKLTEIELFEISLVTFPMLPNARVTGVKAVQTVRDFEKYLRDAGWSRKEAAAIASRGFKAREDDQRDADGNRVDDDGAIAALLESLSNARSKIYA